MNVNPGELDKKIQIQKYAPLSQHELEVDSEGFPVSRSIVTIRNCWAKFTRQSGSETRRNGSEFAESLQRFLVRWSPKEITTDCWVLYNGKRYDVMFYNDYNDQHEYMEIWTSRYERAGSHGKTGN